MGISLSRTPCSLPNTLSGETVRKKGEFFHKGLAEGLLVNTEWHLQNKHYTSTKAILNCMF